MPKTSKKTHKPLYIFGGVAFFVFAVILANLISLALIRPTFASSTDCKSQEAELFFLSVNKSQLSSSAKALAPDYQILGSGGYIWQNENYYHIVSSVYNNKNDALLVQNSLKTNSNITSEIFSVRFNEISFNTNMKNEEKKVLTKALNIFLNTYLDLFDIAISLDTSVYNEISAMLAVNNVHASLSATIADFESLFGENETMNELSNTLTKAKNISTSLSSGVKLSKGQTYSSLIKYRYTELLEVFFQFSKN